MFTYVKNLFGDASKLHEEPLHITLPTDIEVQVGRRWNRRTIRIPQSNLEANWTLRTLVSYGARIVNVDPHIFEVALEFMKQSPTPARSWRRTQSPFKKLTVGDEMMLDLAKAWHLGEMLNLPAMQNELIEAFGARYRQMLRENARILVRPEPFVYLRKHVGYWTKCEMFVIDFLAGLARHTGDFLKAEKLGLSYDIVKALQCVRDSFESEPNRPDLIKEGSTFYKGCIAVIGLRTKPYENYVFT